MIQGNYERILKVISKSSGLSEAEIEQKVEAKRSKLAGLISKEGAAQVIAAELGISFEEEKLKIDELSPGMKRVNIVGKVIFISPVRTFMRNGKEGKVVNLTIADDTSNIKVVLWDLHHINLIEKGDVAVEKAVEIINAAMRDDELHLGGFSELKLSNEVLEDVKTEKIVKEKNISDFRIANNVSTRAFIVQAFEPKFFEVCPECKKKPVTEGEGFSCNEHGKIVPERRALINFVLDDGTETIRSVVFHDGLSGLGLTSLEDPEKLIEQRKDLIGKELVFSGTVRNNSYFNRPEFIVDRVQEINLDNIISSLDE
jgi:replication factor A1